MLISIAILEANETILLQKTQSRAGLFCEAAP